MRKGRLIGALLLFLLPLVAWVGLASAQSFRSGNSVTVPDNETVNSTLFAYGRNLDIAGTVDGDVFCAGMNVTISGTVRGDILCAAQTILVSGRVEGDVRLAGQSVTISGQIERNATVGTSSFVLDSRASIGRDLQVGASDIAINGSVGRDLALAGATATLNGRVGRNVNANVETMLLRGQADIQGGLYYTSSKDAELAEGAQVQGETKRTEPTETKGFFETPVVTGLGFVVYIIISLLILSLALVFLFPTAIHESSKIGLDNPVRAALTGIGAFLAVPIIVLVLSLTVVGLPLAFLLLFIWILVLLLAGPLFSYYIGRLVLQSQRNPFLIMATGALIVLILMFIPILGVLVWFATIWMGSGMLLLEFMRRTPKPSYQVAPASSGREAKPTSRSRRR